MDNLEAVLLELHSISEDTGRDIYIDTDIYDQEGFYIVVSESGKIGAFGFVLQDNNTEEMTFLILDHNKVKYLNDEGFKLNDFYKVMGEKLFRKLDKQTFLAEMSK
jgi:hypothetical protein